ncbi:MAG: penicillin-binding protein [Sandaracinaceae bacterium]
MSTPPKKKRRSRKKPPAEAELTISSPAAFDDKRRRWMRVRMVALGLVLVVGAGLVSRRAWELTMEHGPGLRALAEAQQLRDIRLAPKRGTIYDRHGAELAVSVDVESVFANPRLMHAEGVDVEDAATRLAAVLDVDRDRIATRMRNQRRYFAWIERQVTPTEADAVRALAIPGIQMTEEARRFYPNRELAAHLLGFANIDGVGIEGLELSMESELRGSVQPVPAVRDRRGRVVFSDQLLDDRAAQGDDLYLTIDKTIQHIAERELELSVRTTEARAGSVVVMDPESGDILALANYPTFNPNEPGRYGAAHRRNRAVTDRFEPGSTIKPFTVGGALAARVIRPEEPIDCEHGVMQIGEDDQISDTHVFDILTPAEILTHSSNIGSAKIGMRLGRRGLYRALRRFGFGQSTDLPLPGETSGSLSHHTRWYDLDLATISFGQGISVTTVQLATAMSAIANGGRLMHPRIISRRVDSHANTVQENLPRVRRQVIPRRTARLVGDMLTAVTGQGGTGTEAAIDGYLVAGKTGTAQKPDYVHGGYTDDLYIASFVGFVPAQTPRLTIAVVIDEPIVDHYGGSVAGPVFRRIGEASLRHLGVPAQTGGEVMAELEAAQRRRQRVARRRQRGELATVAPEAPPVVIPEREPGEGEVLVPDVSGMTVRSALLALRRVGLRFQVEGSGQVASQSPEPGAVVRRGEPVHILLERPALRPADVPEPRGETPGTLAAAPAPDRRREGAL